jgi:iron complex transport system substrate-binding protein
MKLKIFWTVFILSLLSCKSPDNQNQKNWNALSSQIQYLQSKDYFELKSGKHDYKIPQIKLPYKKIVLLNASLVGYFTALGLEDKIVGISSPEYIYSTDILEKIKQKKIISVGDESKYEVEKIINLKPDAVFTNYIETFGNTYELLKKNGIEVIFIDEYREEIPLDKSKILKLFGELFHCTKKADSLYNSIEKKYNDLSNLAKQETKKPLVLVNEMYGNKWYMPGGKTAVAHFLNDAGAHYILGKNKDAKAVPLSFEEVYEQTKNAEFWLNIGTYPNKKSLLAMNNQYSKLKVYNQGQLYAITKTQRDRANNYFEQGVVRADWVLMDYVKILHPELLPDYQLSFMQKLE